MITCTFAGHREVLHAGIQEKLYDVLCELMERGSEFCFYVGGMGEFDRMAEAAVRRLRRDFPGKSIRLVLVLPYLKREVVLNREFYQASFDEIIVPEAAENQHFKRAITARNRWMVEKAQVLIAYVHRLFGGAFEMLKFARGLDIEIRNVAGGEGGGGKRV